MRPFSTTMLGAGGRTTTPVGRRDLSGIDEEVARGEAGADRVPVSGWCWFSRLSTAATDDGAGGGGGLAVGGDEGCDAGGAGRDERRDGDVPVHARSGDRCGDGSLGRTFDLSKLINHSF